MNAYRLSVGISDTESYSTEYETDSLSDEYPHGEQDAFPSTGFRLLLDRKRKKDQLRKDTEVRERLLQAATDEIYQLQQKNSKLEKRNVNLKHVCERLNEELEDCDRMINRIRSKNQHLKDELYRLNAQTRQLEAENVGLRKRCKTLQENLRLRDDNCFHSSCTKNLIELEPKFRSVKRQTNAVNKGGSKSNQFSERGMLNYGDRQKQVDQEKESVKRENCHFRKKMRALEKDLNEEKKKNNVLSQQLQLTKRDLNEHKTQLKKEKDNYKSDVAKIQYQLDKANKTEKPVNGKVLSKRLSEITKENSNLCSMVSMLREENAKVVKQNDCLESKVRDIEEQIENNIEEKRRMENEAANFAKHSTMITMLLK